MVYICLCVLPLLVGLLVFVAYRQGIRDGQKVEARVPVAPLFNTPKSPDAVESEADKILAWADSYEG